jgi:hypothetical protein
MWYKNSYIHSMQKYTPQIEKEMKAYYLWLNQKDRRQYAGIEAKKLWLWWNTYIASVLWCNVQTVMVGRREIENPDKSLEGRIRRKWWWDKKRITKNPKIKEMFEAVLADKTAGSPINPWITRTNLKPSEVTRYMKEAWIEVSVYIVKQLFEEKKMWQRKFYKWKTLKTVEWRNEQFENIKMIKEQSEINGNPVISIDTKKKGDVVRIC